MPAKRQADRFTILIEPLNPYDAPGYFLGTTAQAQAIIAKVGAPNLRLMFDCYHVQLSEGDVTHRLERLWPLIGHVQVASVPDRGAPDHGELSYPHIWQVLARLGWDRPVGAEYKPGGETGATLGWWRGFRWHFECAGMSGEKHGGRLCGRSRRSLSGFIVLNRDLERSESCLRANPSQTGVDALMVATAAHAKLIKGQDDVEPILFTCAWQLFLSAHLRPAQRGPMPRAIQTPSPREKKCLPVLGTTFLREPSDFCWSNGRAK